MIKYIVPLISIFLISCATSKDEKYTFIGGKIIHPKDDFVIIYDKNNEVVDSIGLKKDNTFLGKLKNIESGLYYFKHGSEWQYLYLEPTDSLLLRLNTWDFDESLVFSGSNANRNNTLIETFLSNEELNRTLNTFHKLPASEFKTKLDSIKDLKSTFLNNYKVSNNEESEEFLSILKIALHYPLYSKLENYIIKNNLKSDPEKLDTTFTSHRSSATLDNENLMFYTPYRDYVYNNLYSEICKKNITNENEFTIKVLKAINKRISSKKFKNKFLREAILNHFYYRTNCTLNNEAFEIYLSLSTNEKDKRDIQLLMKDIKGIKRKQIIPSFKLVGPDGSTTKISQILNRKNTAIYFRNKQYSSNDWVSSRLNYLIDKNPKVQFIVVNIDDNNKEYIKNLGIKHQYYLTPESQAHEFLSSKFPRVVLINKKGVVVNEFCHLSSKKTENQITKL